MAENEQEVVNPELLRAWALNGTSQGGVVGWTDVHSYGLGPVDLISDVSNCMHIDLIWPPLNPHAERERSATGGSRH
jgi:hypothetical protein